MNAMSDKKKSPAAARPTSRDVARLAGVSQSTVSLVFGGKAEGRVTPERREQILQAAQTLGYRPNSSARGLKLGTQKLLALGVPNVSNPYFASVLKSVIGSAAANGYATVLINTGEYGNDPERLLLSLDAHAFDGMIFWEASWTARALEIMPTSVVVVDGDSSADADVFIASDVIVREMVDHLASLGHTRIARVGFDLEANTFRVRSRAYREGLQAHGLTYDARREIEVPFGETSSSRVEALLSQADRPTAFVCDDDLLAPLVYRAATRCGLKIGESVSVVGVGDIELASLLEPPLTTIAIPTQSLGESAVDTFLRKRAGQPTTVSTVQTRLILRDSTGPCIA
ncbi:LacI family transcription regulator [Pandoraea anapnoica]|uniref:LacI family transcription regulator n=2 Tax=Pandoraea anapnoica TaxID=2508301 RepID=A0A5E4ZIF0_9BURK|nr:LacI family transcription regulator [Pandoraea anapnoica]